jgi:solute carrier family 25 phosphate transporter 23/24/25/41
MGGAAIHPKPGIGGLKAIGSAVARIYSEGGVLAFWTGNGLSVLKIFPESAIKFLTYESSVCGFLWLRSHLLDIISAETSFRTILGPCGGHEGHQRNESLHVRRSRWNFKPAK